MSTHVVIMAGGVGSRFWPMSTPEHPKQFIDVMGCGKTMIQMTVDRFLTICPLSNFWVVTSQSYVDIVCSQLPDLPAGNILAEPCARNTAPCIAYACWKIRSVDSQANIVVTPSDALVTDVDEFRRIVGEALRFTSEGKRIVTLGIKPTRPESGYGYIAAGQQLAGSETCLVESFREKPSKEVAQEYLAAGNYLWNAGIFVTCREYVAYHLGLLSSAERRIHQIHLPGNLRGKPSDRLHYRLHIPDKDSCIPEIVPGSKIFLRHLL